MRDEILYLGPFNPEDVVRRRMLPARNPAAYNRMIRLAKAIAQAGSRVRIVSTGISLKTGFFRGVLHREEESKVEGVPVSVLAAIGIPVAGFLAEPLILICWLASRFIRNRPSALLVYNATIASAMAVVLASLFRIPVIYEVEDVPTWAVAKGSGAAEKPRLMQNLSWLVASRVQRPLSNRVLVPSKRFLDALDLKDWEKQSALVISGCMEVANSPARMESYRSEYRPLKVLFAGKLEAEHGYDLLLGAIDELQKQDAGLSHTEFHICGLPKREDSQFAPPPVHPNIHYHGFVSDGQYKELLADCDIGLALQKSAGLFCETRTPSKAYEFLASGKLLIATRVGDLADLFPHSAICLEPETAGNLAELLRRIAASPEQFLLVARCGLQLAQRQFSFQAVGATLTAIVNAA
jgi:glycosyltransferase involved in cell wall biosynthesis